MRVHTIFHILYDSDGNPQADLIGLAKTREGVHRVISQWLDDPIFPITRRAAGYADQILYGNLNGLLVGLQEREKCFIVDEMEVEL